MEEKIKKTKPKGNEELKGVALEKTSEQVENEGIKVEIANNLSIAEDVIGIIAGIAAAEVEGVSGMTLGLVDGINQILGNNKKYSKGVKIELDGNNVVIDLYVIVRYGVRIPDVAFSIQNSVKAQVETMTGLNVMSVNINVQGVTFDKDRKDEKSKTSEDEE